MAENKVPNKVRDLSKVKKTATMEHTNAPQIVKDIRAVAAGIHSFVTANEEVGGCELQSIMEGIVDCERAFSEALTTILDDEFGAALRKVTISYPASTNKFNTNARMVFREGVTREALNTIRDTYFPGGQYHDTSVDENGNVTMTYCRFGGTQLR